MAQLGNYNDDLNIIYKLNDQPSLSASALKTKFDEAGNAIQTWINSTLIPFINKLADGTSIGNSAISARHLATDAVVTVKIKDGAVTSAKLASQTKLILSGSDIYGNNLPESGTAGQIFFKKV